MFGIKDGYISRPVPAYSTDPPDSMFQPDVYTMAEQLADLCKAQLIIDIGCGAAWKLVPLKEKFCADVVEHLMNPVPLLTVLSIWLKTARVAVLSTPARDAYYPDTHVGPPENAAHVREWSRVELVDYLQSFGFVIPYAGLTRAHPTQGCQTTIAILKGGA